jgi:DtxR family transcriptional regulator, Mn-dependent transcriptional regulator
VSATTAAASAANAAHRAARGQQLTREGEGIAVELVRHHRLLERFLVEVLGYGWDEVHEEAERLEHVLSERMEARIFELLGRPELDPHGDAIPSVEGAMQPMSEKTLALSATGDHLIVSRVSDEDPDKLRALRDLGLLPGAELRILAGSRYESPIDLRLGQRRVSVPLGLARVTYVENATSGDR